LDVDAVVRTLEERGERVTTSSLARELGVSRATVRKRLERGD
jgi:response regulator of citrate/malate metabolism